MFRTDDDVIRVEVVEKIGNSVFPASDISIINMPYSPIEAKTLFINLYNLPADKHLCFVTFRHRKNVKMKALGNVSELLDDWKFFETINLSYQRPAQSNGNCLVSLSEFGILIYKGKFSPNLEKTKWFRDAYANAGNHWDLSPQRGENIKATRFQDFSGEMIHLLLDLASPLEYGRVVYGFVDPEDISNIVHFVKHWGLPIYLYASSNEKAEKIIKLYNECEVSKR